MFIKTETENYIVDRFSNMAGWEEIKRLAADFQRAQLSETTQKLSERNCIEIVQKLIQLKLVEVTYTCDGKQYLTPHEIVKEIEEELLVHGGRITLQELQQALQIDHHHVNAQVTVLLTQRDDVQLVSSHLLDSTYFDTVAEELNDTLQDNGQIDVGELIETYELPAEVLIKELHCRVGVQLHGIVDKSDPRRIYTNAYIRRHRARILGVLSAVTRPISVDNVIAMYDLKSNIASGVINDLIASGRLAGTLSTGFGMYVPNVYTMAQGLWVDTFFKQNSFIEYDTLMRVGINTGKSYMKDRYKASKLIYLSTCVCEELIIDRMQAEIDEALSTNGWVDVTPHVPSIFSDKDIAEVLKKCMKSKPDCSLYCDVIIAENAFIEKLKEPFGEIMATKAQKDALQIPAMLAKQKVSDTSSTGKMDKKEQRRKKAAAGSGKSVGGSQGRETKTKSTKKKYRTGGRGDVSEDSADEGPSRPRADKDIQFEFLSTDEICQVLNEQAQLKECDHDFKMEIAEQMFRPLRRQYQDVAKSVFLQTSGTASSHSRKQAHAKLQEKIVSLWTNVCLFEKGMKFFEDGVQELLSAHLLKTLCTDMTNALVTTIAADHIINVGDDVVFTSDVRAKLIASFPAEKNTSVLVKMNTSLNGKNLEVFLERLNEICDSAQVGIMLRKPDKKKEKQLVANHRQSLIEQLKDESDSAMALHLACVLMFQIYMQSLLHAPGRCVPHIIALLQKHISEEEYDTIHQYQELVMMKVRSQKVDDGDIDIAEIDNQLTEKLPQVKEIALNSKRKTNAAES